MTFLDNYIDYMNTHSAKKRDPEDFTGEFREPNFDEEIAEENPRGNSEEMEKYEEEEEEEGEGKSIIAADLEFLRELGLKYKLRWEKERRARIDMKETLEEMKRNERNMQIVIK